MRFHAMPNPISTIKRFSPLRLLGQTSPLERHDDFQRSDLFFQFSSSPATRTRRAIRALTFRAKAEPQRSEKLNLKHYKFRAINHNQLKLAPYHHVEGETFMQQKINFSAHEQTSTQFSRSFPQRWSEIFHLIRKLRRRLASVN
jgi:hypothetical protein